MTRTTEGIPDDWVSEMLESNKFRVIHDFEDSKDCFPGVDIKGGKLLLMAMQFRR